MVHPGDLVGGRFQVERLAGEGGMASVYRAVDRVTGAPVALKVLHATGPRQRERFGREAALLAELRHPAIVGYVAHGALDRGAFLAMEWLEGEDLGVRLGRGPLAVGEVVTLGQRLAGALAVAHARGVVHRDVKPSNVVLVGGRVEEARLIDFGVARLGEGAASITRTGLLIGTPAYMAPEQARGAADVGPRADVFALGAVLFECLAGRAAFQADHPMAVLARVLLEDAPLVAAFRADTPPAIESLLARTLAKAPEHRPADGRAVLEELAAIEALASAPRGAGPSVEPPAALTERERPLFCVVLAGAPSAVTASGGGSATAPTLAPEAPPVDLAEVCATAERHGGRAEQLVDGSVLVTLPGSGAAGEQAVQAARCALALRPVLSGLPMALATGRGEATGRYPVGEVLDRGVRLLAGAGGDARHAIAVDEVTAGLLDARFEIVGDERGLSLAGERDVLEPARTLLGKKLACLGREREIGALVSLFDEVVEESAPRVVLLTGPAGVGKSRVRHEALAALRERGERALVLVARADGATAGSPFGLLGQAVRAAAGIREGEPLVARQHKVRACAARSVPEAERARVAAFLGEIAGAPFPEDSTPLLRAARADSIRMGDHMRRAFEDWLAAESASQPVVLVFEDLHWGDRPSVGFVDTALRNLADRPLLVVAIARPEVHAAFPDLWSGRGMQVIAVAPLTRRSSERFVRLALGDDVSAEVMRRIVAQAEGNAFYLEELVRAVAEGKGDALPGTVMAMVEARLEALEPEARRALRAASVFGQSFTLGAARALLGGPRAAPRVAELLAELERREILARRLAGSAADDEYAFRHALVREAAYATLTDADRTLGHRLAAGWLAANAPNEALAIASHLELCGEPRHAAGWFRRSAELALEGNDFASVAQRVDRGICSGATGEELGALLLLRSEAHRALGENASMQEHAERAMTVLASGSVAWWAAAANAVLAAIRLGQDDALGALLAGLWSARAAAPRGSTLPAAAARIAHYLYFAGRDADAGALLTRSREGAGEAEDAARWAWIHRADATRALCAGDLGAYLELLDAAVTAFERAGDVREPCSERVNAGFARLALGLYEDAESALREAMATAERLGLRHVVGAALQNLAYAVGQRGDLPEARRLEEAAIAIFAAQGNRRMEGDSAIYLARLLEQMGDLEGAERAARRAVELLGAVRALLPYALATLAAVLLRQGRIAEAAAPAREAAELFTAIGHLDDGEAFVRLVHAEVLAANGEVEASREVLTRARTRLLERAAQIRDPTWRASFLERVPENVRTLAGAGERTQGLPA